MKFYIWVFLENLSRKFKFHYNLTRITGTLHEDQYTFFVISRWVLLWMKTASGKICRENLNTNFTFNIFFFENRAINERKWKVFAEWGRPKTIMWHMRITWWLPKGYKTQSEYVIVLFFARQKLYERTSMLSYTYIVSLINSMTTQVTDFEWRPQLKGRCLNIFVGQGYCTLQGTMINERGLVIRNRLCTVNLYIS